MRGLLAVLFALSVALSPAIRQVYWMGVYCAPDYSACQLEVDVSL